MRMALRGTTRSRILFLHTWNPLPPGPIPTGQEVLFGCGRYLGANKHRAGGALLAQIGEGAAAAIATQRLAKGNATNMAL